jgi:hypothetical protein
MDSEKRSFYIVAPEKGYTCICNQNAELGEKKNIVCEKSLAEIRIYREMNPLFNVGQICFSPF